MANLHEQRIRAWDEWLEETGQPSGDPAEFIEWALRNKKLTPHPEDIRKMLRRQVTQSLRQEKRYDIEGGFTYRAKQSVTLFQGGESIKHYFDTDTGGSPTLRQKSVKQRREAIAYDVYRAACDTERMNRVHKDPLQLTFFTDFTDDVAELRLEDQDPNEGKREA